MKKIVLLVCLFIFALGTAYSQLRYDLWGAIEPDFLQYTKPIGDAGNPDNNNLVPYRGTARWDIFNGGTFRNNTDNLLGTSGGFIDINTFNMSFQYKGPFYSARLKFFGSRFVAWGMGLFAANSSAAGNTTTVQANKTNNNENSLTDFTFASFMDSFVDEYHVTANFGLLTVYFGNEDGNAGRVSAMNNHTAALYSKIDALGLVRPSRIMDGSDINYYTNPHGRNADLFGGGIGFVVINTRNPRRKVQWEERFLNAPENEDPYFLLTCAVKDFDIALGTHLQGPVWGKNTGGNPAKAIPVFSAVDAQGYFRISGNKVFDLASFDLVYRVRGKKTGMDNLDPYYDYASPTVDFPTGSNDGSGVFGHSIGLFFQPVLSSLVKGLNITGGYSATFHTLENFGDDYDGSGSSEVKRKAPAFHGIDLRASYTGLNRFLFTTQNNISFAGMKGNDDHYFYGLRSAGLSNDLSRMRLYSGETDNWFFIYNTLGARYAINSQIFLDLGLANRLGILREKRNLTIASGDIITAKRTNNWLSGELMGSYIKERNSWEFWTGLAFVHQYSTYKDDGDHDYSSAKAGRFVFAVPIRFHWRLKAETAARRERTEQ
jgi:hypothetical protein